MVSKSLNVKRMGDPSLPLPIYQTLGAAAVDLTADEALILAPGEHGLVRTGFAIEIPTGMVGLVCPRSGLALKHGVTVLNAPGVIDCDYRGEVGVILINLSDTEFLVHRGSRIAQLLITPCLTLPVKEVDELSETFRGEDGFGSTGR